MGKLNNNSSIRSDNDSLDFGKKILERTSRFKVPAGSSAEDALALLKVKIVEKEKSQIKHKTVYTRSLYLISSIAALLLLFFCVWQILVKPGEEKLIAERGSQKEITMPDGSRVRLNADSKITWSGKQFNNDRHVSLTGEAFFEVSEGKPFTISTKNGNIKVPGTSFNVYARDNSFKVSCFTGQIIVSAGDKSVIISQGESAELSADSLKNFSDNYLSRKNSWINGEFFYENSCLINVFEEIERQFNVKYDADGLENEFFTGSFTNKDLKSALDIVCIPMGLNYEIGKNRHILITKIKQ
jgi:ferric-dicitrate binding protein FerR (iron transport regulator)